MQVVRSISLAILMTLSALAGASPTPAEGEVRKVDKDAGKLTIRHGELKDLAMPPMTMVFRVKDKSMLERLAVGDKVRFSVEKIEGALTVITLEALAP